MLPVVCALLTDQERYKIILNLGFEACATNRLPVIESARGGVHT